jgi:hypothetical protein
MLDKNDPQDSISDDNEILSLPKEKDFDEDDGPENSTEYTALLNSDNATSATAEKFKQNNRDIWRKRTFFQDITQTWLNDFVSFASTETIN